MILVDTSIWVDHLRRRDEALVNLLEEGKVLTHPFVIGEVALGSLPKREIVLGALYELPCAAVANEGEVLHFIEQNVLFGRGIGYLDTHLLAAVRLTRGATLWTRDKRLREVARQLDLAMP